MTKSTETISSQSKIENEEWLTEFFRGKFQRYCGDIKLDLQSDGSLKSDSQDTIKFKEAIEDFFADNPHFYIKDFFDIETPKPNSDGKPIIKFNVKEGVKLEDIKAALTLSPHNFYKQESEGRAGVVVPAFNLEGLMLTNHLNGLKNVFICKDDKVFAQALELLNKPGVPDNMDLMLVRVFENGKHVQPIKIERRDGVNNVIIMDSRSSSEDTSYTQETVSVVKKTVDKPHIFCTNEDLQIDGFSCYLYTAKFLKLMAKHDDLTEKLKSSTTKEIRGVSWCKTPEDFFAMVQSRRAAAKYIGDSPEEATFTKKDGEKETLSQKLVRPRESAGVETPNYIFGEEKPIPSRPDHFARKYAANIDEALKNMKVEKLEGIIAQQDARRLNLEVLKEIGANFNKRAGGDPQEVSVKTLQEKGSQEVTM